MIENSLTIIIFSINNNNDLYNNLLKQSELLYDKINIKIIQNSNKQLVYQNEWININQ